MAKKKSGMSENTAGALAYLLGIISGVYFLVTDKRKSVKFHAGQSIVLSVVYYGLMMVLPWSIRLNFGGLLGLVTFVVWLVAMYQAYQGNKFKIPVIGDITENVFK